MNGNKAVDLHVHSNISDGTDSPEVLVQKAVDAGLSAFALTDHDTINGISPALDEARRQRQLGNQIEVIPGVELSTFFDRTEIHIVGLFIDYDNDALNSFLNEQVESRINRNRKVCELFQNLCINISYEDMLATYPDAVITRAHFADRLVNLGICGDRNEAFDRFLSPSKPCYVNREKVSPKTAIRIIHETGGVAILAHPVLYHLGNEQMNKLLDYVCESGIDGIEAIYSTYKMGDELNIRRIAKERNLLISGGSDYHGNNKPHISLGTGMGHLFIPYEVLENLRAKRNSDNI
ncbi:MAG: PHP domain-containing protein [Lachnospira sp.]